MNQPIDAAGYRFSWHGRAFFAGLLLTALLILTAFAPASFFAPIREQAPPGVSSMLAPSVSAVSGGHATLSAETEAPRLKLSDTAQIVPTSDPEPGIGLISAVYNSIQDRFFRPLDSRDLLGAAWEGTRRALAEQRRMPTGVNAPEFTGDRAGDLETFLTQYRALLTAAGPNVDATRVAMITADLMTQSVGEQHTVFLPPDAFARFRASVTTDPGRVGLGIGLQGQAAPFTISSVVPSAPADKAGVREGDVILAIDGRDVQRMDSAAMLDALRGEEGQPVALTLQRAGADAPIQATVVRARFSEPPLTMRVLPQGVCLFRLTTFPVAFVVGPTGRTIGQDWDYYLEQCEQAGGKGWIVDLRGNGGGAALEVALGRFLPAGPLLVEKDRVGGRYELAPDGHLFRVQRPLAVLIDGNSASASEAFASAVQEYKRGVVMGRRSMGALNTMNIIPLPLDAGMGVAIREVFTGNREVVVDEIGVSPDMAVSFGRDPNAMPDEVINAVLNPPSGVGPLASPGSSGNEGLLSADELKRRAAPVLLQAGDVSRAEDQAVAGDYAYDTLSSYTSDYPSLSAARERALRLGWQGIYARWLGTGFPPPFAVVISYYSKAEGAHDDLREIYQEGEPRNPPQYKEVPSPVSLGDETMAQVGTGSNEGRIWISWRRGSTVYVVSQTITPGDPQSFDEIARLAQIVDQRAQANP